MLILEKLNKNIERKVIEHSLSYPQRKLVSNMLCFLVNVSS